MERFKVCTKSICGVATIIIVVDFVMYFFTMYYYWPIIGIVLKAIVAVLFISASVTQWQALRARALL